MNHTPGPWRKGLASAREIYDPKSGHTICRAPVADAFPNVMWEHNALLIAAAPELFRIVNEMVTMYGADVENDKDINGADAVDWISQIVPECIAAIAKAEGRG